jgi:uncharacterized protein (DUF2252 family)
MKTAKARRSASGSNGAAQTTAAQDHLRDQGKALRASCPRSSHAAWTAPADRPDPVQLLEESSKGRIPSFVPIRVGRMALSPFTFFRGAALNMATDLAGTPATGLRVQACGDCHLLNFGGYATPERRLVFDINDLDETLPAPWEWDVKRLGASFILACRNNGFSAAQGRDAVRACVRNYRERMAEFAQMRALDVWYSSIDFEKILPEIKDAEARTRTQKQIDHARRQGVVEHEFPKMTENVDGVLRIKDQPPLIYHPHPHDEEAFMARVRAAFAAYRETIQEDRRFLLDRFRLVDVAAKVVGVGSVGTWCGVLLLMAGDMDPLFLQVKEARASVLEPFAGASKYSNHGQRVVNGYRLMQAASDIFLGWTVGEEGRHFYLRQLRDLKVKPMVELLNPGTMNQFAQLCGWALARGHARSGEPAQISGYLGKSEVFDEAIADFSVAYADQTEQDHAALMKAIRDGRIEAQFEAE